MARRYTNKRGPIRQQRLPESYKRRPTSNRGMNKTRLMIGLVMVGFTLFSYFGSKEYNPITGEDQYISITPHQEIALGLQATPDMITQYGGLYQDQSSQDLVDQIGNKLVQNTKARETEWEFEFHLLADPDTVNAFALPGGQVFITMALFSRLETTGQLAGVLGHEIGHVVARHGAQRMAKSNLTQGLTGAVMTASGSANASRMAQMVGQMINMQYGRDDELESDKLGVYFMAESGYDPRSMIGVMKILAAAAGGGSRQPEFFSTHPNPDNRIERIEYAIGEVFPNGVPHGLEQ